MSRSAQRHQRTLGARPSRVALAACAALAVHCGKLPEAAAAEPARRWYGDLTLLADGGALTLLVASIAVNDRDSRRWLLLGSGSVYAAGAPVVHLTQERGLASLASLGLRVGFPALGGLLGSRLSSLAAYDDGDEVVIGTVLGVLGGTATAVIVDAALLAWEPPPAEARARRQPSWWPTLALTSERAVPGVAGRF